MAFVETNTQKKLNVYQSKKKKLSTFFVYASSKLIFSSKSTKLMHLNIY